MLLVPDVTAVQFDPTSVLIFWTALVSANLAVRYDIYYVVNGSPSSTRRGSTTASFYVLTNLQVGVQYTVSIRAVATYLPSQKATVYILSQFHY